MTLDLDGLIAVQDALEAIGDTPGIGTLTYAGLHKPEYREKAITAFERAKLEIAFHGTRSKALAHIEQAINEYR